MTGTTILDPSGLWEHEGGDDPAVLVAALRERAEAAWAEYEARPKRGQALAAVRRFERDLASGASVSNEVFRERALDLLGRGESSLSDVCRKLGGEFLRKDGHPDTSFLMRVIGLLPNAGSWKVREATKYGRLRVELWHGHVRGQRHFYGGGMRPAVAYDLAVRLAEALEMDPVDAGV